MNFKLKAMKELNARKFSSTALEEKPDILQGILPEDFLKSKYDTGIAFGLDNLHRIGHYLLMGWSYDFTPYMKQYLVKQYDSWQEYWAPNKTLLRKSLYGRIQKIVLID